MKQLNNARLTNECHRRRQRSISEMENYEWRAELLDGGSVLSLFKFEARNSQKEVDSTMTLL